MKKCFFLFLVLFFSFISPLNAQKINKEKEIDSILNSVEHVFKLMEAKDFCGIWQGITERSKKRIVDDIYKEEARLSKKENRSAFYTKEMIFHDFNTCNKISKEYWHAFLTNFDPKMALEQSTWSIGKIEQNYAEVILHYRKSERPAVLQVFKENGVWKLGLVETFWASIR